jgi:5-methylcytosine-specific restriction endonuclease McrA
MKKISSQQKKARLRKKADKVLQEIGRAIYNKCLVCGKPNNTLHHFYPKSTCASLRYNIKNCIPLCNGCHFSHHNGNPEIHNRINEIKGKEWLEELRAIKKNVEVKDSISYYENIIRNLILIKPYKIN